MSYNSSRAKQYRERQLAKPDACDQLKLKEKTRFANFNGKRNGKEVPREYFYESSVRDIVRDCKAKNIPYDVWFSSGECWKTSDDRCPILDQEYVFSTNSPLSPEFALLFPEKGYVVGNVLLLSKAANLFVFILSDEGISIGTRMRFEISKLKNQKRASE